MSEAAPTPPETPPAPSVGGARLFRGFLFGVALMVGAIYLGSEVDCAACHGTGRLGGSAEKVRWSGTAAGVECLMCEGSGRTRRFLTFIENR